jgi:hypothetical protein
LREFESFRDALGGLALARRFRGLSGFLLEELSAFGAVISGHGLKFRVEGIRGAFVKEVRQAFVGENVERCLVGFEEGRRGSA